MEKLEKHIKEKLEERRLSPTIDAWEQVASSLDSGIEKRNKKSNWYAIAASLIGLLIVSALYFNTDNESKQSPQVVDVDTTVDDNLEVLKKPEVIDSNIIKESEAIAQRENNIAIKKDNFSEEKLSKKAVELAVNQKTTRVNRQLKEVLVITTPQDLIIEEKVNEVLATVLHLERESIQITDAEVDSLLRVAQFDILKEKMFQDNGKVDAMALLIEVEDEIDQSFREKIFKKLKDGLFKARTAIANRNN